MPPLAALPGRRLKSSPPFTNTREGHGGVAPDLAGPGFAQPKRENFAGLIPLAWHHSSAWWQASIAANTGSHSPSMAVPLGWSWILRPASLSTFSQAAM